MPFNPKAPPVYRLSLQSVAGPPVYRLHQVNRAATQLKPANNFRLETRPAPPVYRPNQADAASAQLKPANNFRLEIRSAPLVYRPQTNLLTANREPMPPGGARILANNATQRKSVSRTSIQAIAMRPALRTTVSAVTQVVQPSKKRKPDEDEALERLKRAHKRNLSEKSEPTTPRAIFDVQQSSSYGYDDNIIDKGILKGSFRRGFAKQPFLMVKGKSDYDSIIAVFEADEHTERDIARAILSIIYSGKQPLVFSDETVNAMSTLIMLTQVIESHDSRIPGADKWARSCLRRIKEGRSTFRKEFNRAEGNFLPSRAKAGGSKVGGQEAGRAALEKPKKSDKAKKKDVVTPGVAKSLAEMSDSSDDEG